MLYNQTDLVIISMKSNSFVQFNDIELSKQNLQGSKCIFHIGHLTYIKLPKTYNFSVSISSKSFFKMFS